MPYVSANGVNLHYWQLGQGADLVMIHGFGGNLAVWHFSIVGSLRDQFRITTYDLRGHGRSDLPATGYTTHDQAMDLCALMDALQIERAALIGHSLGADIALHSALIYPERVSKVIAVDAMLPLMLQRYKDPDWEGWTYWAGLLEQIRGVKAPKERWQDVRYMLTHSLEAPVLFGPFRGRPRDKVPITRLLTETSVLQDFDVVDELTKENLCRIIAPTLLIYDSTSPFLETCEVLRSSLPHVEVVLLPSTELRHFSPLEQPDLIIHHTRSFLAQDVTLPRAQKVSERL